MRWDGPNGKEIRPVARHADGWRIGAMLDPKPLYHLPKVLEAEHVIVTEGEKCAEAASSLGYIATTSAGGSKAASKSDWSPLAGKEVWILPDNDIPGRKYADEVTDILTKLTPPASVRVIDLPDLPEGGDIVDWIAAHGGTANHETLGAIIEALATGVEPCQPDESCDLKYIPFPVDVLPEPIQGFVKTAAKAIGCDHSFLVLPLLAVLASAIGNTRRLELKQSWSVPPIVWTAIVGDSGDKKSPGFRLVTKPLQKRQKKALKHHSKEMEKYEVDLFRWESDMAKWKRGKSTTGAPPRKPIPPEAERYIVNDTTVEALVPLLLANPRGLLLVRDELAGWLGSFDQYRSKGKVSADSGFWLSTYNAESIIVDRKHGTPRTIYVPEAAVCITGGIQPGILKRALSTEHRESGLAARLLFAAPPRTVKRWTDADIDPDAEAKLCILIDRLFELSPVGEVDGEPQPGIVRLSDYALRDWEAYYNVHNVEQVDHTGDLAAAWSKLEEYAARLALVIHFIRWAANDPNLTNAEILDEVSMNAGITLTGWFKHEAQRIYAMLDETEHERNDRRLIVWIERKGGTVTPREVQQGCRRLKDPGKAVEALQALVNAGSGSWIYSTGNAKGGHPSRRFALRSPSTVYKTPATDIAPRGFVDVDTVDTPDSESDCEPDLVHDQTTEHANLENSTLFPTPRGLPD